MEHTLNKIQPTIYTKPLVLDISKRPRKLWIKAFNLEGTPFVLVDKNNDGDFVLKDGFNGADINQYEVHADKFGYPKINSINGDSMSFTFQLNKNLTRLICLN